MVPAGQSRSNNWDIATFSPGAVGAAGCFPGANLASFRAISAFGRGEDFRCPSAGRTEWQIPPVILSREPKDKTMSTALWAIIGCGVLAVLYGIWAVRSVLKLDAGCSTTS